MYSLMPLNLNAPKITKVSPDTAKAHAEVAITGTNFSGVEEVTFGGVPADSFYLVDADHMNVWIGSGTSGYVNMISACGDDSVNGFVLNNSGIEPSNQYNQIRLSVYPNPVNNELNISLKDALNGTVSVMLFDQLGRLVINSALDKGGDLIRVNTSSLSNGVYVLKITTPTYKTGNAMVIKN